MGAEGRRRGGSGGKRADRARQEQPDAKAPGRSVALRELLWILVGFFLVALFVYAPALHGVFISDDNHYVAQNPYIQTLNFDNVVAIWNPGSVVTKAVENYAPVHLMLHGFAWQLFGEAVLGHHVLNVLLHALAATLLVPIYLRSGISRPAAILGAGVFLLHPANVESVAWISQLKSASALILSLLALQCHPRRPLVALLLFTLALFAKPFSAFALIVVALFGWLRGGEQRWPWLGAWLFVVLAFAVVESGAFALSAGSVPPLYADPLVRALTIVSVALRYLLMAATGYGLSTFHEPPPVTSLLDPWLIGGVIALALLGWRTVVTLLRREEEAVYWLWAVVSFAPLSGVVPLPYPMADRYLYFVLPGLIGAVLLAWPELRGRIRAIAGLSAEGTERLGQAAIALCALLLLHFAWLSNGRAHVFQNADALMADAELHYPDGVAAQTRKASRAARMGDFDSAVRYLRAAQKRGYNNLQNLLIDPSFGPMHAHPGFMAVKAEMADDWIARLGQNPNPSQIEARQLAQAYIVKEDLPAALAIIERGIEVPGPITDELRGDAEMLRREIRLRERLSSQRAEP